MKLVKFLPNRVWRVYLGGRLLDELQGVPHPADASFPEEWIGSTVPAINPQYPVENAGISVVLYPDGTTEKFDDFLRHESVDMLGSEEQHEPGFLTKLLDSAIRLPAQVHPTVEMAQKLFASSCGKTEAWIVLAGRQINGTEPYLLMGFNEQFDEEIFKREVLTGNLDESLKMMHRYPVVPGEVILIPGGLPHAIGPGVLVQEIMEPRDWVIQPENRCGEQELSCEDKFCGLDPEAALSAFDCRKSTLDELIEQVRQTPELIGESAGYRLTRLIDREKVKFFGSLKLELSGVWHRGDELAFFMAVTVISGEVKITSGTEEIILKTGESGAVGALADAVFSGNGTVLLALPPVKAQVR